MKVLPKMDIIMPKDGAEACIGIRNDSSLRTTENYPSKYGWQNNGSKGAPDKRDNVIYRTKNQMTARRMEEAAIDIVKHMDVYSLTNTNEGGGGALGLRTDKRGSDGKPIFGSDPGGYCVYCVYRFTSTSSSSSSKEDVIDLTND